MAYLASGQSDTGAPDGIAMGAVQMSAAVSGTGALHRLAVVTGATAVGMVAWTSTSSVAVLLAGVGLGCLAVTDATACRLPKRAVTFTVLVPAVLAGGSLVAAGGWSRLAVVLGAMGGVWFVLFRLAVHGWVQYGDVRLVVGASLLPTVAAGLIGLFAFLVAASVSIAMSAPLSVCLLRPSGRPPGWVPIGPGVAAGWLLVIVSLGGGNVLL